MLETLEMEARTEREAVVQAEDLTKVYRRGEEVVRAVDGLSFRIDEGEFVAVVGPSGAGKTTTATN